MLSSLLDLLIRNVTRNSLNPHKPNSSCKGSLRSSLVFSVCSAAVMQVCRRVSSRTVSSCLSAGSIVLDCCMCLSVGLQIARVALQLSAISKPHPTCALVRVYTGGLSKGRDRTSPTWSLTPSRRSVTLTLTPTLTVQCRPVSYNEAVEGNKLAVYSVAGSFDLPLRQVVDVEVP